MARRTIKEHCQCYQYQIYSQALSRSCSPPHYRLCETQGQAQTPNLLDPALRARCRGYPKSADKTGSGLD